MARHVKSLHISMPWQEENGAESNPLLRLQKKRCDTPGKATSITNYKKKCKKMITTTKTHKKKNAKKKCLSPGYTLNISKL
jgi:hypothetical protein